MNTAKAATGRKIFPVILTSFTITKDRRSRKNISYEEAKAFVRSIGIKTSTEWKLYIKGEMLGLPPKPLDIPFKLDTIYKRKGWVSWKRFLGTERR